MRMNGMYICGTQKLIYNEQIATKLSHWHTHMQKGKYIYNQRQCVCAFVWNVYKQLNTRFCRKRRKRRKKWNENGICIQSQMPRTSNDSSYNNVPIIWYSLCTHTHIFFARNTRMHSYFTSKTLIIWRFSLSLFLFLHSFFSFSSFVSLFLFIRFSNFLFPISFSLSLSQLPFSTLSHSIIENGKLMNTCCNQALI